MKVIGAGLPRTGTLSLQAALHQLNYPCYHMESLIRRPSHIQHWHELLNGESAMDWHCLFQGFEAAVDAPACFYVQEILQAYPDAKVILTVRDPEAWYASMLTLRKIMRNMGWLRRFIPRLARLGRYNRPLLKRFGFDPFSASKEEIIRNFHIHNKNIEQIIPKERLLIFQVSEGWEPLCSFLGCAVPQGNPFPHLNAGTETIKKKLALLVLAELSLLGMIIAIIMAFTRFL